MVLGEMSEVDAVAAVFHDGSSSNSGSGPEKWGNEQRRYHYLEQIGSGTFGEAWLVQSSASGRRYVVKKIKVTSMNESECDQSVNEVAILSRCKHFNIIRYREAFIEQPYGTLNIVMEYADGGDLYERICQKRANSSHFQEQTILNWFVQITFAVQYLHSNNILHRDLKTQNIFLTKSNLVKVGDFGIARSLRCTNDLATTAIGTPYYLSPEICQRRPYNHKSDQWAVGCVLYEMCSLSHPFNASDFESLVLRILRAHYTPIPGCYSSLVRDLISVLLRSNPEKRPSAEQVLMIPAMKPFVDSYLQWQNTALVSDQTAERPRLPSSEISPDSLEVSASFRIKGSETDSSNVPSESRVDSSLRSDTPCKVVSKNDGIRRSILTKSVQENKLQLRTPKTPIGTKKAIQNTKIPQTSSRKNLSKLNQNTSARVSNENIDCSVGSKSNPGAASKASQIPCSKSTAPNRKNAGGQNVSNSQPETPKNQRLNGLTPCKESGNSSLFKHVLRSRFGGHKGSNGDISSTLSPRSQAPKQIAKQPASKSPAKFFSKPVLSVHTNSSSSSNSGNDSRSISPVGELSKNTGDSHGTRMRNLRQRRSADGCLAAGRPKSITKPKRFSLDLKRPLAVHDRLDEKEEYRSSRENKESVPGAFSGKSRRIVGEEADVRSSEENGGTELLGAGAGEVQSYVAPRGSEQEESTEKVQAELSEATLRNPVEGGWRSDCHNMDCCALLCGKCRHVDDIAVAQIIWQCRKADRHNCAKLHNTLLDFLKQRMDLRQLEEITSDLRTDWPNSSSLHEKVWKNIGVQKAHLFPIIIRILQLEHDALSKQDQ